MKKEEFYRRDRFVAEARRNPMSFDMISDYARQLHSNRDVVADLVFAHEANAADYSDDDFAALGSKVSMLIQSFAVQNGMNAYKAKTSGKLSALADFNGWYMEKVHYEGHDFESALADYIKASPHIIDN
ncbi:MAG: hypothetical protein ACU0GG_12925 [Paracoccaceae bacterium]